jgi:hypothetical protein
VGHAEVLMGVDPDVFTVWTAVPDEVVHRHQPPLDTGDRSQVEADGAGYAAHVADGQTV